KQAAAIQPSLALHNEPIALMALTDLRPARRWPGMPREAGNPALEFDPRLERYARSDGRGVLSVRRVDHDRELARLPAPAPHAPGPSSPAPPAASPPPPMRPGRTGSRSGTWITPGATDRDRIDGGHRPRLQPGCPDPGDRPPRRLGQPPRAAHIPGG